LFVDMPEVFIAYQLPLVLSGDYHAENFRLVIEQVVIEKKQAGESNVKRLKAALGSSAQVPTRPAGDSRRESQVPRAGANAR
jgi:phage terminase large subunit-like protein